MTTPEQPDDASDPATGPGRGHSAPRPVPPLTPASRPGSPESGTDADPDATSVALPRTDGQDEDRTGAPTRVSAFPAFGRSRNADDGEGPSRTYGDDDRTRAVPVSRSTDGEDNGGVSATTTPVVAPGPATDATTRIPTSGGTAASSTSAGSDDDNDATRVVPLADPDALAGSTNGRLKAGSREPLPDEDWAAEPTKRGGTHVWGVLGILVAAPVTWFLLTDGALRTFYGLPPEAPLNPAGLLSLAGGLVGLVIIAVVTRVTSLGSWIWGGIIALAGLAALVFPIAVDDLLTNARPSFLALHEGFGTNLHDYLTDTGRSGVLLLFGLVLLLLAFVSHGARRSGRYEGRVKAEREARGL